MVPWSKLPGAAVLDVGPPSGGALELPGPRRRPVRPHLELSGAPAGIAGRVVQGDGKVLALAVRDGDVIPLAAPPLAVAARSHGIWAMYRDGLVGHDLHGAPQHRVAVSGVALIAGAGDAVWVASTEKAWHVDAGGTVAGPFAWHDPLASFPHGGRLCTRDRKDARVVTCLASDGSAATVGLAVALAPFEQPIALDGDRLVTLQGVTVRQRRGAELLGEWTLQGAGLDAAGAGFAVSASDGKLTLWRPAGSRVLPPPSSGSLSAASVSGEDVLLYSQGWSTRHHGATAAPPAQIDEATYRTAIFPSAWEMSPQHAIAVRADGTLVVAGSGPAGAALVELRAAAAP
ncbi:MAG TPA: hypothetical protein VHW23_15375 [Kofleriaceae bacterium]|nr:hypothetical protein [Kofleriaceae bacterium]